MKKCYDFLLLNYFLPLQEVLRRVSWCQAIWLTSLYHSCRWSTGMWNCVHVMHMQLVAFSRMRGLLMKWLKPCCTFLRRRNSSLHRAANPFLKGSISFCHNGEQHKITETQSILEWSRNDCWYLKCKLYNANNAEKNFIFRVSTLYRTGRERFAHGQPYWNYIFKNFLSISISPKQRYSLHALIWT